MGGIGGRNVCGGVRMGGYGRRPAEDRLALRARHGIGLVGVRDPVHDLSRQSKGAGGTVAGVNPPAVARGHLHQAQNKPDEGA